MKVNTEDRNKILRFFFDTIDPSPNGETLLVIKATEDRLLVHFIENTFSYQLKREGATTRLLSEFHENWADHLPPGAELYQTYVTSEEIKKIRNEIPLPEPREIGRILAESFQERKEKNIVFSTSK